MFDEKGWGASIRGLVKWNAQQSIRYNERTLDQHTPNAIATTPDQTYVFAACLNHTLKVWNLATNKLVGSKDLLDRELSSQQHESTAYFLNPSDSTFVRVFNAERALDGGYRFYVVTYSPHEEGQFKFWAVKGGLTTPLTIEDLFPGTVLRPRDPDTSGNLFWSVSDFQIRPMDEGKRMELWILWRNNNLYQLYSLHFDFQSLEEDWSTNWTSVAMDTRRQDFPPALVVTDIVDPTEKWLKYFFYPGRYNPEVLETALGTYQEAIKLRSSAAVMKRNAPLQERMCSTIAGSVSLRKYTDNDLDYAKYRTDTDTRWRQFWQIAEDLGNRRLEPICLAYDTYSDLPWVVLTDSCVVVRECSATELLLHNSASELRDEVAIIGDRWRHRNLETELGNRFDGASHLINVAAGFRKRLSGEAHRCFQTALDAEIFLEPSLSAPDRLTAFQERSELGDHVSDDVFDSVCAAMNELLNIYKLPKELFYAIMDTIPLGFPAKDSDLLPTAFGLRVTMSGSQETILHIRRTLHDLLMLVVFVSGEVGQEDSSSFDAVELFTTLLDLIKEYEMLYWLGSTTRISPHRGHHEPTDSNDTKTRGPGHVSTILEDLFAIHIKPRPTVGVPQSYTLTLGIRDVLSWVTRQGEVAFPNVLVFIQCDLIANGNIELASEFLRFQPSTAWATYAKGRLFVARTEYETAALYFQKAAHSLCKHPLNLRAIETALLTGDYSIRPSSWKPP
jgi:nuclear pore complex protein Nup160